MTATSRSVRDCETHGLVEHALAYVGRIPTPRWVCKECTREAAARQRDRVRRGEPARGYTFQKARPFSPCGTCFLDPCCCDD